MCAYLHYNINSTEIAKGQLTTTKNAPEHLKLNVILNKSKVIVMI